MASKQCAEDEVEPGVRAFLGEHLALLRKGYSFSGHERDKVFWNRGGGRFLDISGASGADSPCDGRAAVYLDADGDGDLDIFLRSMHGPAHRLFENVWGERGRWLRVALEGTASGRDAFGAVVVVTTEDGRYLRVKDGGGGFLSQGDPRLHFGLGAAERVASVEVRWPSGARSRKEHVPVDGEITLVEPGSLR